MSNLQYHAYESVGKDLQKNYYYSQAVRIPAGADRIELAGQGPWDPTSFAIPTSEKEQIAQAFSNVELALKDAGVKKGWGAVFRVNSYHVGMEGNQDEVLEMMVESFKRVMPDHQPIWTCIGVTALGLPDMKVEIEVVAYDG